MESTNNLLCNIHDKIFCFYDCFSSLLFFLHFLWLIRCKQTLTLKLTMNMLKITNKMRAIWVIWKINLSQRDRKIIKNTKVFILITWVEFLDGFYDDELENVFWDILIWYCMCLKSIWNCSHLISHRKCRKNNNEEKQL